MEDDALFCEKPAAGGNEPLLLLLLLLLLLPSTVPLLFRVLLPPLLSLPVARAMWLHKRTSTCTS